MKFAVRGVKTTPLPRMDVFYLGVPSIPWNLGAVNLPEQDFAAHRRWDPKLEALLSTGACTVCCLVIP